MEAQASSDEPEQVDVRCVECGHGMRWGDEYQLPSGDDYHALCADCKYDRQ